MISIVFPVVTPPDLCGFCRLRSDKTGVKHKLYNSRKHNLTNSTTKVQSDIPWVGWHKIVLVPEL